MQKHEWLRWIWGLERRCSRLHHSSAGTASHAEVGAYRAQCAESLQKGSPHLLQSKLAITMSFMAFVPSRPSMGPAESLLFSSSSAALFRHLSQDSCNQHPWERIDSLQAPPCPEHCGISSSHPSFSSLLCPMCLSLQHCPKTSGT